VCFLLKNPSRLIDVIAIVFRFYTHAHCMTFHVPCKPYRIYFYSHFSSGMGHRALDFSGIFILVLSDVVTLFWQHFVD